MAVLDDRARSYPLLPRIEHLLAATQTRRCIGRLISERGLAYTPEEARHFMRLKRRRWRGPAAKNAWLFLSDRHLPERGSHEKLGRRPAAAASETDGRRVVMKVAGRRRARRIAAPPRRVAHSRRRRSAWRDEFSQES
ncbi:hypothetical protein MTO96_009949 [Rhipicephalus appendiculatus]